MASWDNAKLLEELIEKAEKRISVTFGEVVASLQAEYKLDDLAALIEAGQWDLALETVEAAAGKIADVSNSVFVNAGEAAVASLGDKLGVIVSYAQVNDRAVSAMQANKLDLVREFTTSQREATREALLEGIRDGVNPRAQARNFRDSIGLTRKQQKFISNYRRELRELNPSALYRKLRDGRFDGTLRKAIEDGKPLSKSQIDKMVGRYRERWIKYRSEVIARTEALRSVHQGMREGIQQAIDSGVVEEQNARQTWNTARDERVRDFATGASTSHATMHLQERKMGEPFESGAGNSILYPGDPAAPASETIQCRCRVTTRVSL